MVNHFKQSTRHAFSWKAWKHRSALEKLVLDDPKRWLCIVGVDAETRLGMTTQADKKGQPWFELEEPTNEWGKGDSTRTGDNTVPYFGARCAFIPVEQIVCLSPDDFGFFEFGDKLLAHLGYHGALPSMDIAIRLTISHLRDKPQGNLWARCSPEIDPKDWDPPIKGLARK